MLNLKTYFGEFYKKYRKNDRKLHFMIFEFILDYF